MKDRYQKAETFQEFLATVQVFQGLWRQIYERARLPKVRAWFARDRGRTTLKEILSRIPVTV